MKLLIGILMSLGLLVLVSCAQKETTSAQSEPNYALEYDLYIHGGLIVDGTGNAPFQGDVLVRGNEIAFVGQTDNAKIKAARTIDATHKTVTPGFIDAHSHGNPLRDDNDYLKNFLRQGITTVFLGQDGDSPSATLNFTDWFAQVDAHKTGPNIAALVGHGTIRTQSGGGEKDKVTSDEQIKMEALLATALEQGAYGLSSGLEYLPGRYADAEELNGLAKVVGKHDGIISSHIRSEDADKVESAVAEVIVQGKYAKVNVTHIKIVYGNTRAQGEALLKQIRDARKSGMTITADVYPYLASHASLILLYPEWAKREAEFNDAVANRRPEFAEFLRAKIKQRNGAGAVLFSTGEYASKTLQEVSDITGKSPEDLVMDFGHPNRPSAAHFIMSKQTQDVFITAPDVSISTDGSPTMRHPRSFGSFPKVLEEYVVRDKLMSIELAIHKMTGLTAQTFGIQSRGFLKAGMAADILVIDLPNLKPGTDWTDIPAVPTGFDAVIVNGKITDTAVGSGADVYGKALLKTDGD